MFRGVFVFCVISLFMAQLSVAQYFDPFVVDLYEQAGVRIDWTSLADDEAWYSGEIVDFDKLQSIGIQVDEPSDAVIKFIVNFGDRWALDVVIDTMKFKLWYYPGCWEMFYKYDRINENVTAGFYEICDLSDLAIEEDQFHLWTKINADAFFIDTKMIMFGTAWPGIKESFKYEHLGSVETGDDVTLMNLGDYKWKYIFPETGLEMKVVFTLGNFIER